MRYLLDTSVLIHSMISRPKLNSRALGILADDSAEMFLSPVTSWEMVIKASSGKLELPEGPSQVIARAMGMMGLKSLDITHLHALAVGDLPKHHRDPFDRMLIVQAQSEDLILLTADRGFEKYDVQMIFCGK